jgi:hypothetical protein
LVFFHFHQILLTLMDHVMLARATPYFSWKLLIASAVNAGVAVILFPVLDHLRKPS